MSKMILLCAEDSAPATLIDPASAGLVRKSEGLLFTDDVEVIKEEGDYVWLGDIDSTVACMTKDLATIGRRDLGYYSQTAAGKQRMFHLQGAYLYALNTRKRDGGTNAYDPLNENQLTVLKFDKYTLAYVGESVLSDALFWDDTGKTSLLDTGNYIWAGPHLWIKNQANWDWYKIDINTGALVDTWTEAAGAPQWTPSWSNATGTQVLNGFTWSDPNMKFANFAAKTTNAVTLDFVGAGVAAGKWPATAANNEGYSELAGSGRGNMPYIDEQATHLYFVAPMGDSAPEWNGLYKYHMVRVNYTTGEITVSDGVLANVVPPDSDRLPVGMTKEYTYFSTALALSPTVGYLITTGCTALVDFTTGVITPVVIEPMQGYAQNSVYWRGFLAVEVTKTQLSGTVLNGDSQQPIEGVTVYLLDQDKMAKLDETKTNAQGVYTFQKYTSRKYLVVCQAPADGVNYKVKARL